MLNRKGFTLIELLIVVVIIGILAAIAIPKFSNTKEKAYLAAMKSDLRNLVTAEEAYFADNTTYTADKTQATGMNYTESAGVTVAIVVNVGPPVSYNGIATHTGTAETCAIYINEPPAAPAINEGEPRCT
jgi:prepilin-type N-terminal cleavage/methylation domain-containing protein